MNNHNYSFWVSYFASKDGQNKHGACEMKAQIDNDATGSRWRISAESLLDWTQQIQKATGDDAVVILTISPMFGHF